MLRLGEVSFLEECHGDGRPQYGSGPLHEIGNRFTGKREASPERLKGLPVRTECSQERTHREVQLGKKYGPVRLIRPRPAPARLPVAQTPFGEFDPVDASECRIHRPESGIRFGQISRANLDQHALHRRVGAPIGIAGGAAQGGHGREQLAARAGIAERHGEIPETVYNDEMCRSQGRKAAALDPDRILENGAVGGEGAMPIPLPGQTLGHLNRVVERSNRGSRHRFQSSCAACCGSTTR